MGEECLMEQPFQSLISTAVLSNWQVSKHHALNMCSVQDHPFALTDSKFSFQAVAAGALLGLVALYIANKVFDWGLLGRPVYLVDIFCFRPPER